jgi:hypothetical protein
VAAVNGDRLVQEAINIAFGALALVAGWVFKMLWDDLKEIKADIKDLTHEVHTDFARRDDFKDSIAEIKDMLGKIFQKLDQKADK